MCVSVCMCVGGTLVPPRGRGKVRGQWRSKFNGSIRRLLVFVSVVGDGFHPFVLVLWVKLSDLL